MKPYRLLTKLRQFIIAEKWKPSKPTRQSDRKETACSPNASGLGHFFLFNFYTCIFREP